VVVFISSTKPQVRKITKSGLFHRATLPLVSQMFGQTRIEPRKFDCPNCGDIGADGVRQAERDEVCLYVCRQCDAIANERLPF
jgi:hypothetical protein